MIKRNKRLISLLLNTLVISTLLFPKTAFATEDNGKMWFSEDAYCTFNIKGYYNGSLYKTTFSDKGYSTTLKVGSDSKTLKFSGNPSTITYKDINITQYLSFVSGGNYVKIQYTLKNTSNSSQTISLACDSDVQIGSNDCAPIYMLDGKRGFRMVNDDAQFMFIGRDSYGVTNVDTIWFGKYSQRQSNRFNSTSSTSLTGTDSGMAFSWVNRTIQSGETQTYSVLIGIGALNNPPTLNFTSSLKSSYTEGEVVPITGSVNDTDSGDTVSIKYAIDDGTEYSVPGSFVPNGTSKNFSSSFTIPNNLAEGTHNLKIWAVDDKGNMSNPKSVNFTVVKDKTPPSLNLSLNNTNWTNGNVTISANASDDKGVKKIVTPSGEVYSAGTTYTVSANGTYYFTAYDIYGNTTKKSITVSNIDKTVPTSPNINIDKNILSLNGAADSQSGIKSVLYKINNGVWETYSTSIKLEDGEYTIYSKAVDNANNEGAINSKTFIVYEKALQNALQSISLTEQKRTQTNINNTQNLINVLPSVATEKVGIQDRLDTVQIYLNASKAVSSASIKRTTESIDIAQGLIDLVRDETDRANLQAKLDSIKNDILKAAEAEKAVSKAEMSKMQSDVDTAQIIVDALTNDIDRVNFQSRLDKVQQYINDLKEATDAVINAETTKTQTDIDAARELVDGLINDQNKTDLINRLDKVQQEIDALANAVNAVEKAENLKTQESVDNARKLIELVLDEEKKDELTNRINVVQAYLNRHPS